eukprot:366372-Chlamydomonas_euryale.AAC.6
MQPCSRRGAELCVTSNLDRLNQTFVPLVGKWDLLPPAPLSPPCKKDSLHVPVSGMSYLHVPVEYTGGRRWAPSADVYRHLVDAATGCLITQSPSNSLCTTDHPMRNHRAPASC